jgi:hypothetical protein
VQAGTEQALSQVEPDALHWVQLGRIGWQGDEEDVFWNQRRLCDLPACAVGDERGVDDAREAMWREEVPRLQRILDKPETA